MLGSGLMATQRGEVAGATKLSGEEPHSTDIRKMITFVGAMYFLLMTTLIVPVACVSTMILLIPITWFSLPLYNLIEHRVCRMVANHWVATSAYSGMRVVEYGADIRPLSEKRVLLLPNHLGLLDHFIVMQSLHDKGSVSGRWIWVIYNIWKYTPLGFMWSSHGNFFVNGGASQREALLTKFRQHVQKFFTKFDLSWVIMYPEGSRLFLIKESAKRFAEKLGLSPLEHCVHPRTGAAHAVMDVMAPSESDPNVARCGGGPPVEYIVDATIGYPHGEVPDLGNAMMGEWPHPDSNQLSIHYSIHKTDPKWADEGVLKTFLYEQYEKKDQLLKDYYAEGRFPGEPRPVIIPQSTMLISQLFWLGVYYAHYLLWIRPLCLLLCRSFLSLFA